MIWKEIPGFPDYEVSEEGEVRSYKRSRSPHTLKPLSAGYGRYRKVILKNEAGVAKNLTIHTLVALTFIGPRPEGMEIRHLDGDGTNNNLTNLAYGTKAENTADLIAHGRTNRGERMWACKLNERKVRIIRGLKKLGFKQVRIAEIIGCTPTLISAVLRRQCWAWVV